MYNKINKSLDSQSQTVIFVCSPNLAIIDNWAPILVALRKKLPKANFLFILPKYQIISDLNLNLSLLKIIDEIFDLIIFKSRIGIWLYSHTLRNVKEIEFSFLTRFSDFSVKIIKSLNLPKFNSILSNILQSTLSILLKQNFFDLNQLHKIKYITLFDIREIKQLYFEDLKEIVSSSYNFSIQHEMQPRNLGVIPKKVNFNANKTTIFSFLENDKDYYKKFYDINENQVKVYGIPKHDKNWIKTLIDKENLENKKKRKYIFLISSPIRANLTRSRKKKYLEYIKLIAKKFNFKIIIRLHPKEKLDKIYEDVFGANENKINWEISIKHPFVLGKNCEFAISFGSSVALDLLALDIPTIQIVDTKNFEELYPLRDINGNHLHVWDFLKLSLNAKSFKELETHVNNILSNKSEVIMKLKNQYNNLYKNHENINELLVKNIIEKV